MHAGFLRDVGAGVAEEPRRHRMDADGEVAELGKRLEPLVVPLFDDPLRVVDGMRRHVHERHDPGVAVVQLLEQRAGRAQHLEHLRGRRHRPAHQTDSVADLVERLRSTEHGSGALHERAELRIAGPVGVVEHGRQGTCVAGLAHQLDHRAVAELGLDELEEDTDDRVRDVTALVDRGHERSLDRSSRPVEVGEGLLCVFVGIAARQPR